VLERERERVRERETERAREFIRTYFHTGGVQGALPGDHLKRGRACARGREAESERGRGGREGGR
jgi:hypothetical protein